MHPPRWAKVWEAIKSLFDVDGDRVTSIPLQAELGKAKAIIVTRRAAGSLGGQTTRFNRSMNPVHRNTRSIPKPLINNDVGAAKATANYNYNIERKEEERSDATRPETVASELEEKRASRVVPFETPSTIPQSPSPEGPTDSELKRALQDLGESVKLRGGSAR